MFVRDGLWGKGGQGGERTVIAWEFVVEVVVSFSEGDERGEEVIPGSPAVIEDLVAYITIRFAG